MCCLRIEDKFVRTRCNAPPPPNEVRKRRCRVEVWIEQGIRNGRMTTPTLEEIVPCRPASHAGRERVWGSCGERGQKFGSRWVGQPSQEVVPFLSIRINPPVKKRLLLPKGIQRTQCLYSYWSFFLPSRTCLPGIYHYYVCWYGLRDHSSQDEKILCQAYYSYTYRKQNTQGKIRTCKKKAKRRRRTGNE